MLGVHWIESNSQGIPLRGALQLYMDQSYYLSLVLPYQGPKIVLARSLKRFKDWRDWDSDWLETAKERLIELYNRCEQIKPSIPKFTKDIIPFWEEISYHPVVSPLEWNRKRNFLRKAMRDGYIDHQVYEKTLADLAEIMLEKWKERETKARSFLLTYFPEAHDWTDCYEWLQFCYEHTEKNHMIFL